MECKAEMDICISLSLDKQARSTLEMFTRIAVPVKAVDFLTHFHACKSLSVDSCIGISAFAALAYFSH